MISDWRQSFAGWYGVLVNFGGRKVIVGEREIYFRFESWDFCAIVEIVKKCGLLYKHIICGYREVSLLSKK